MKRAFFSAHLNEQLIYGIEPHPELFECTRIEILFLLSVVGGSQVALYLSMGTERLKLSDVSVKRKSFPFLLGSTLSGAHVNWIRCCQI
jgi:hypothetical protein